MSHFLNAMNNLKNVHMFLNDNSMFRNFTVGIIVILDKTVFYKTFMPSLFIWTNFQQVKYPTTEELLTKLWHM